MTESTRCPFLKEMKVAFCRAFPLRKMLPFDRICPSDSLCFRREGYPQCPVYRERRPEGTPARSGECPFLEVEEVIYCEIYPVKKMIPASCFRLECPCNSSRYVECPVYRRMLLGDRSGPEEGSSSVQGFLLEGALRYHPSHLWLREEAGGVRLGMDDFGQFVLGTLREVRLPEPGRRLEAGQALLWVVPADGGPAVEIPSPLGGTVLRVNERLREDPTLVNLDPYGEGWLVELRPEGAIEGFYRGPDAERWLAGEVQRLQAVLSGQAGVTLADGGEVLRAIRERLGEQGRALVEEFFGRKGVCK